MGVLAIMALLFGGAFYDTSPTDVSKAQSFVGVIFLAVIFIGIINSNTTIPVLALERAAYYREQAANMYSALPYVILSTLLFIVIFYYLVGLWNSAEKFFLFWFVFFLYNFAMTLFGQMLAIVLPNQQVATIAVGAFTSLNGLFSGFLIAVGDLPDFWLFMAYITPLRYAINSLVSIQMECDCTVTNGFSPILTCNGNESCADVCNLDSPGCNI